MSHHNYITGKTKYMNPYLAGIILGLVLLLSFYLTGRGLGASGAMKSAVVSTVEVVSHEKAESSDFYHKYVAEGQNPMKSWLVFEMLGVLVGGFLSGALAGRLKLTTEHSPKITSRRRIVIAVIGGALFGFGSQFGRGCTSGAALSGMATLSLAGFVTMMAIFGTAYVFAISLEKTGSNMAPIIPIFEISQELNFLIAFIIGIGFGFALEQAGFSSSRKLAGMFYGYDTTVLKVFFTAAIVAMLGLSFFNYFGLIDMGIVYINEYFVKSAIIGGVIMGVGFIIGGFCPGTSVCAAAIGKVDAMAYLGGSLIGIFAFGETYALWKNIYMADYLGGVKLSTTLGISDGLLVFGVIVMAVIMFWIGEWAEKKFKRPDITEEM